MGFNGQLLYCGGVPLPIEYIANKSYKFIDGVQDLDSERTADGKLYRNALEHRVLKVEITLIELTGDQFANANSILERSYIVPKERKLMLKAYNPFINDYVPFECYVQANLEGNIDHIDKHTNTIYMQSQELHFIGY